MAKKWEFDAFLEDGDEDFASYVGRFEHYCEVANVQEEKLKKSAFITAIGKNAYKTLKDLLLPATPAEKSLAGLVKVLSDHYEPASRIIAERFRFNRRYQVEGTMLLATTEVGAAPKITKDLERSVDVVWSGSETERYAPI
ncbi:hypothetical protein MTO96_017747 [Rhipicephalus appendiculatus]